MQKSFEKKCNSSKIDQITQDQSKNQGNLKQKDPNMIIRFARITWLYGIF
jgi:hypothetical protein